MKISELIELLQKTFNDVGDVEVLGIGHPGEHGCEIEERYTFLREKDGEIKFFLSF